MEENGEGLRVCLWFHFIAYYMLVGVKHTLSKALRPQTGLGD